MKLSSFLLLIALVLAAASPLMADAPTKVDNIVLNDVNGTARSLADYAKSKAIVLMFIATQCPVSNAYNSRMADLHKEYSERGVTFLGINSNKQESVEEIRDHAKENGFGFLILKDPGNTIADKLEASVTPEIYVLNGNRELLYHGRIDDNSRGTKITSQDLRMALDEILAGKTVSVSRTKAFGCTIKRVNR